MADLILEPYTVVQRWSQPAASGDWESRLSEYLQTLAQNCAEMDGAVIGHIKALALFPEGQYLRASVVSADRLATVEGCVPHGFTTLELTLNVLVYGLTREQIKKIVERTAREAASRWGIEILSLPVKPHLHSP